MSESNVLRSSASPKNGSPHMDGGGVHAKVSNPKPPVNVTMSNGGPLPPNQRDRGVVLGKSNNGAAQAPQPRRAMPQSTQPQAQFQAAPQAAAPRVGAPQERPPTSVGGAKPMVMVNMQNGKPSQGGGNTNPRGSVVILGNGRTGNRPIARRASGGGAFAQASLRAVEAQRQAQGQGQGQALLSAPAQASSIPLSKEQLMLCRHAVTLYAKSESANELTSEIATSTLETIDALLSGAPAQVATEVVADGAGAPEELPIPQFISGGGRAPAGIGAPRRFASANQAPVRRVVPAPTEATEYVEGDYAQDDQGDGDQNDGAPDGVIDVVTE